MAPSTDPFYSSRRLSPFVYWSQTEDKIILRVILQDVTEPDIVASHNFLQFTAHGVGANAGRNEYFFKFNFFKEINPNIDMIQKASEIILMIEKIDLGLWPRLTEDTTKLAWLKLDFDKLKTEEDEEEEQQRERMRNPPKKQGGPSSYVLSTMMARQRKLQKRIENFRKIYLFLYNMCQFVGFFYVLLVLGLNYAREGEEFMPKAYSFVRTAFLFVQVIQILEIVHPLLGYTKGSAFPPFLQVFGRMFILLGMINAEPRIQTKPVVFYLIFVYTLSEVIRYPYYMLRVYNSDVGFLTWLRYTIWIPLYPLGFLFEGIIILRNIPYFEETQRFSVFLPNAWNFSVYFPSVMRIYLLLGMFPLLYFAMTHMYRQRVKILGSGQRKIEY